MVLAQSGGSGDEVLGDDYEVAGFVVFPADEVLRGDLVFAGNAGGPRLSTPLAA